MIEFALVDGSKMPILFVPDIKTLIKILNGDMGIADHINNRTHLTNLARMTTPEQLKIYAKAANITLPNQPESYFKNGKSTVKQSDLVYNETSQTSGLKALEKSFLQSLFESQKPYIEIARIVLNSLVSIEDIIARVLALAGNSLNPAYNPKALGYLKRDETIQQTLSKLKSLQNLKSGSGSTNNNSKSGSTNRNGLNSININRNDGYSYQVISTEYSTGTFDPNVNYTYEYIDIKDDNFNPNSLDDNLPDTDTNNDPYGNIRPKTVVMGIFDADGRVVTDVPSWLANSGKWFGQFNLLGLTDNREVFPAIQLDTYRAFYKSYINDSINANKQITNSEKPEILETSMSTINVEENVKNYIDNGFLCDLKLSNGPIPLSKSPFIPKYTSVSPTQSIWLDPETDYDMKVIRVKVEYTEDDNAATNSHLQIKTPYSGGYYGSSDDETTQSIDEVTRYTKTFRDRTIYYLVEGIVTEENSENNGDSSHNSTKKGGKRVYRKKDFFTAVRKFINLIVSIFSKLVPSIKSLLKIISNPSSFIFDVLTKKLGDNNGTESTKFSFFTKSFMDDFSKLSSISKINRKDFVSKSQLRNFVYVNKDGDYKFLLDGSTLIEFFGITFGMSISKLVPSLIFKLGQNKNTQNLAAFLNQNSDKQNLDILNSSLFNASLNQKIDSSRNTDPMVSNLTVGETITYSTGVYVKGVDYTYIYVNDYIAKLISEANDLASTGEPDNLSKAANLYQQAIKADPSNDFIKSEYEKLKKLLDTMLNQPILSFLLNMITFPFKVIKKIIEFIMDFFSSLGDVKKLPSKIKEFITFEWIKKFFTPTFLLEICGIKFDIGKFKTWIKDLKNYSPEHKFDMSEIMSMPFMPPLFSVNKDELKTLINTPIAMLSSILCLLESIINAFIDLVWSLFGLAAIIKPPYIKLCKDSNKNLTPKDIMDLLNGNYLDALSNSDVGKGNNSDDPSYDFIYNIKLPDGRNVRDLNTYELEQWISENKNLIFEFDF